MADTKDLGTLLEETRQAEHDILVEICSMSDRHLSYALERDQIKYDRLCSDYAEHGESYMPNEPRRLQALRYYAMLRLR